MDIVQLRSLTHELTLESWFQIFGEGAKLMESMSQTLNKVLPIFKVHPVLLANTSANSKISSYVFI